MADKQVRPYAESLPLKKEYRAVPQEDKIMPKKQQKGNPFKRGDTWTIIYYVQDPLTGKRKQKWKGGYKTRKEAADALAVIRGELVKGTHIEPCNMTFKEYSEYFLECRKKDLKPNTILRYRTTFEVEAAPIADIKLKDFTVENIIALDEFLKSKGYMENTIIAVHQKVRTVFNYALKQEDIVKSPYRKFTVHSMEKHEVEIPDTDTLIQFVKKAKEKDPGTYGIVLFGMLLGLRRGEIAGLRFCDFDFEDKTVHIQRQIVQPKDENGSQVSTPKTKKGTRIIGVPDIILDYVREQEEHCKEKHQCDISNFYVLDGKEKHRHPVSLTKTFKRFARDNGLGHLRLHDLRHAFASICLEQKVQLKVIADMMGHKKVSTTAEIYCETTNLRHETAEAVNRLAK